jgi:hypothetical protein
MQKEEFEDTKGRSSESVNQRRTDNTLTKRKKYKGINNDLQNIHIKLKIELLETIQTKREWLN